MAPKQPITPRPGKTLADMHPAIGKDIDPELNGGLTAYDLSPWDTYKPTWRCELGHVLNVTVRYRISGGGCRICKAIPPYEESLEYLHPEIADQFDEELTDMPGINPRTVGPTSSWTLGWRCEHGHRWRAPVYNRAINGSGCRQCYDAERGGIAPTDSPYLKDRFPDLFARLNPDDNPGVDLDKLKPRSHTIVSWTCPEGHANRGRLGDMVRRRNSASHGCRTCKYEKHGDIVSVPKDGEESLATSSADFLYEWDWDANAPITPDMVKVSSGRKYAWICRDCGHKWTASAHGRSKGNGCPPCALLANAEVRSRVSREDSFGVLHPHLVPEWDVELNKDLGRTPFDVSPGSDLTPYWTCSEGHTWQTSVYARARTGSGCAECIGHGTSAAEQFVVGLLLESPHLKVADDLDQKIVRSLMWGRTAAGMKVDGLFEFIPTGDLVVFEYDGCWWHREPDNFDRDERKTKALLNTGHIVVRLREEDLPHLDLEHPRLFQISAPTPQGNRERARPVVVEILKWIRDTSFALAA